MLKFIRIEKSTAKKSNGKTRKEKRRSVQAPSELPRKCLSLFALPLSVRQSRGVNRSRAARRKRDYEGQSGPKEKWNSVYDAFSHIAMRKGVFFRLYAVK